MPLGNTIFALREGAKNIPRGGVQILGGAVHFGQNWGGGSFTSLRMHSATLLGPLSVLSRVNQMYGSSHFITLIDGS